jgi:hypothetical protein
MAEQLYGLTFLDSGSTYLVSVTDTRNEAEDWMERLEAEHYEEQLRNGEIAGNDEYEPIYRVKEFDPAVLDEDDIRRLENDSPIQID